MLSVNGQYSIMFYVETLNILLFTVIEDLAVRCCNYYKKSNAFQKYHPKALRILRISDN